MKIEVPVRGTITINGRKLICLEDNSFNCDKCALKDLKCSSVLCGASQRTDGKNVMFQTYVGVLFDRRDVVVNIPEVQYNL